MTTIATYIDQLSIINIKIFMLENIKRDSNATNDEIAEATKKTNTLNVQRTTIVDIIDLKLNNIALGEKQTLFGSNKMYGK